MEPQPLTLEEALDAMNAASRRGESFWIRFVTANRERPDESGRIVEMGPCVFARDNARLPVALRRQLATTERRAKPKHLEHGTIDVHIVGAREIRRPHTWIITRVKFSENQPWTTIL